MVTNPLKTTLFGRHWNAWVGTNTTLIKNDSRHLIHAIISSKQNSISEVSISKLDVLSIKFSGDTTEDKAKDKKFMSLKGVIPPGRFFPFRRTNSVDYLTIVMKCRRKREDGGFRLVTSAENIIIYANESYRVDEYGIPHPLDGDEVEGLMELEEQKRRLDYQRSSDFKVEEVTNNKVNDDNFNCSNQPFKFPILSLCFILSYYLTGSAK